MKQSERPTVSIQQALEQLNEVAPGAPLLALGQTVFWDEPMKAGVALAALDSPQPRSFIAGIHDTDYFAKLPSSRHEPGKYLTVPHNDASTRGLWSAAGEFSTLFGSETVVSRDLLVHSGLRLASLQRCCPNILDKATEAWGWRGIVSMDHHAPITAEVPLRQMMDVLSSTLDWAIDGALLSLAGASHDAGAEAADSMRTSIRAIADADLTHATLSEHYRRLTPVMFGLNVPDGERIETTTTRELLQFNTNTCDRPRFALLGKFVEPATRDAAVAAYDLAVERSGLYGLSRFGTGAVPFDVVIPGEGRGTLRIGTRGAVIATPNPQFLSFPKPLTSLRDLAAALERKFGPNCAIVGKAVTLIGMLCQEFVFVFHEGASGYVKFTRRFHQLLAEAGIRLNCNPILRVAYDAWGALAGVDVEFQLPEPFRRPFGAHHITGKEFAERWRGVSRDQEAALQELSGTRRPMQLIEYLCKRLGGSWTATAREYRDLHDAVGEVVAQIEEQRERRRILLAEVSELKRERARRERAMGDQFRAEVFERQATSEAFERRRELGAAVQATIDQIAKARAEIVASLRVQRGIVSSPELAAIHKRRRDIEMEGELKRMELVREAVTVAQGLRAASLRPSAWWFPLVSPDGAWYRETIRSATCYLEPLSA